MAFPNGLRILKSASLFRRSSSHAAEASLIDASLKRHKQDRPRIQLGDSTIQYINRLASFEYDRGIMFFGLFFFNPIEKLGL
jgi:hypothetical protein